MHSQFESVNLLWLLILPSFLTSLLSARAESPYLSKCNSTALDWYVDAIGETPCMTYQRLRQLCNSQYQLPQFNPLTPGDACDTQLHSCCCNYVAFSLSMLCFNCQYNNNPNGTGIDAGLGAYFDYADGCTPMLNYTINLGVQSAVCNSHIDLGSWLYTTQWPTDGPWCAHCLVMTIGVRCHFI